MHFASVFEVIVLELQSSRRFWVKTASAGSRQGGRRNPKKPLPIQKLLVLSDFSFTFDRSVKAVVFDAVGTIIYPLPSVADAYREAIAKHCNVTVDTNIVSAAVREALASRSVAAELTTSEEQERGFWADLIRTLCPDGRGFDECFEELFAHFAAAKNWRCFPDTAETIAELQRRDIVVAIASNFDDRLNAVCDGLPEICNVSHRVVSSLVGYRKPAAEFFHAVSRKLSLPPEQILMVGDDPTNDVAGALAAGMQAVLIDRSGTTEQPDVVSDLRQLLTATDTVSVSDGRGTA